MIAHKRSTFTSLRIGCSQHHGPVPSQDMSFLCSVSPRSPFWPSSQVETACASDGFLELCSTFQHPILWVGISSILQLQSTSRLMAPNTLGSTRSLPELRTQRSHSLLIYIHGHYSTTVILFKTQTNVPLPNLLLFPLYLSLGTETTIYPIAQARDLGPLESLQ